MSAGSARLVLVCFSAALLSCNSPSEIREFSSDGCSLFPDTSLINKAEWTSCCLQHDIAYWQGGTQEQRRLADEALQSCVLERTGDRELADLMYNGVRLGGSPYFYNWYRWGYGWSFERKYQALSEEEQRVVREKLDRYLASQSPLVAEPSVSTKPPSKP